MVDYGEFPDAETLVSVRLRDNDPVWWPIEDQGPQVFSSVPRAPTWPLILVRRIPSQVQLTQWIDRAILQFDVYGTRQTEAHDIAAMARVRVLRMRGKAFTVEGGDGVDAVVARVEDELSLQFIPDPSYTPAKDRYVFSMALTLHPLPVTV